MAKAKKRHDEGFSKEPWCVLFRVIKTRPGHGIPRTIRVPEEQVAYFLGRGWSVLVRDSELPAGAYDADQTQSNPQRSPEDDQC